MDTDEVKVRPGAVAWRQIEGETVLLDLSTSEYLGVNEAGTVLWDILMGGATRETLAAALQERFGIDAGQATTDVDAFLADLSRRNLLVVP